MKKILSLILTSVLSLSAFADEGMWLLPLLDQLNGSSLMEAGCKLTPEEIYSINHGSLKDAIIHFGGGCTGEIVSAQGLIATNHHCGYSHIQGLSTPEHNYLMNGYWAKSFDEEIPAPGLSVTFLISMEDVSDQLSGLSEKEAKKVAKELTDAADAAHPHCTATVVPFYNDNVYYLIVYKTYTDIRFVGAPPASIGKFGGETDNWMWPRHTGDFSMFRVYAGEDNEPAAYAPENRPYQAERFLKTSLKGVKAGDYTMILGYPGRTQRFQTAAELEHMIANNRVRIDARTVRQDLMWEAMCADPNVQLSYASKYASSANGWKKWQGESKGILECDVIGKKKAQEADFQQWVNANDSRAKEYGNLLDNMRKVYSSLTEQTRITTFVSECVFGPEIINKVVHPYYRMMVAPAQQQDNSSFEANRSKLLKSNESFRKSYCPAIDKEAFVELFTYYFTKQRPELIPVELHKYVQDAATVRTMMTALWDKQATMAPYFTDNDRFVDFLTKATPKQVAKTANNELLIIYNTIYNQYRQAWEIASKDEEQINAHYRTYVKALMEKEKDRVFYPDANLTLRVTYGQVKGFEPADGVDYDYYTTLDGIIQKEDPDVYDYKVDPKLKQLWEAKDYGRYANKDGKLPVAFIASNHTTGGNSGSPVINGKGELIGTNFDRVWEGTMSDIYYDVSRCRNISLDARYFLFIVDKFANAQNLIEEMTIVE